MWNINLGDFHVYRCDLEALVDLFKEHVIVSCAVSEHLHAHSFWCGILDSPALLHSHHKWHNIVNPASEQIKAYSPR